MSIAMLRANRIACQLAAIGEHNHVHIAIRRRSWLANASRSVLGLFDVHGWEC